VNASLGVLYQRQLNPAVTESELADFVDFQYSLHRRVPGGTPPYVERGRVLPRPPSGRGTVFVVGDCRGLYWSAGDTWRGLERTPRTGGWRLDARFPRRATTAWQPLLTSGERGRGNFVAARVLRDGRVVFGYYAEGDDARWYGGRPVRLPADRRVVLDVVDDARTARVEVAVDGETAFDTTLLIRPVTRPTIGRSTIGGPVAAEFEGELRELPIRPVRCRDLLR
jgi:hypothetical protein